MMLICALVLLASKEPVYAKPELLIEPKALIADAEKYLILDARSKAAYDVGHVPGALRVDVDGWSKAMNAKEDAKAWAKRLGALGVENKRPVVVYGVPKTVDAVRVWWILRYWGLSDVRVLNGGYDAFIAAGGMATKRPAEAKATEPVLKAEDARLATKEEVLKGLKDPAFGTIIDARTADEHCGVSNTAKRNGSIPDAKHLNWTETMDRDGRFRPAPELAKLFKDAGIDPEKPATTYCQSGGRASVMAFTFELMTGKPARNYYRSWAEWGNDASTPVVKPKK